MARATTKRRTRGKNNPYVVVRMKRKVGLRGPGPFEPDTSARINYAESLKAAKDTAKQLAIASSYGVYEDVDPYNKFKKRVAVIHPKDENPSSAVNDVAGLIPGVGEFNSAASLFQKHLPKQRQVDRFLVGRSNPSKVFAFKRMNYTSPQGAQAYQIYTGVNASKLRQVDTVYGEGPVQGWRDYYTKKGWVEVSAPNKQNPAEDIELLNDLAPDISHGHIAFTQEGLEEFVRDGYIYHAYANTPVFEDGYRMGTPVETVEQLQYENPAKFDRCVKAVQAKGGPVNAYAVCTAQGLRNPNEGVIIQPTRSGNGKWQVFVGGISRVVKPTKKGAVSYGKRIADENRLSLQVFDNIEDAYRKNPASSSDELYTDFHGAPPSETLEIEESFHVHEHLGGLGDLVCIQVRLMGGSKAGALATITAPDPNKAPDADVVRVAGNEERNQMYLVGGDQAIDLKSLGYRDSFTVVHDGEEFESTEIKDHMVLGEIEKLTYQTEKSFDKFKEIQYFHKLGEDTKVRPFLTYDTLSKHMGIYGGEYVIHEVGVVN